MKTGDRVSFYTVRKNNLGREYVKQCTGTCVAFNDLECEIVPDGKKNTIRIPLNRVQVI